MRYKSKQALLSDIRAEYDALNARLRSIPAEHRSAGGVWGDGWSVSDLVAHLAEWQRMFLRWYAEGLEGKRPEMPAPGFKWNETPRLNRAIRERNRLRRYADVLKEFETGNGRIVELIESLSDDQLLTSGHFEWTGRNSLVTFVGANTSSHYRFASKVLKRWASHRQGETGR